MIEIIPAILAHSKSQLKEELALFSPLFSTAQLDIMDGRFVGNKTITASAFKGLRPKMKFEVHLMVKDPLKHAKAFSRMKYVKRILFHYEACKDDQEILDVISFCRKNKLEVGLAINPSTDVDKILHLLPLLDAVLVMGVTPGWSGQRFRPTTLKRLSQLRRLDKKVKLQFDGGVNRKTIKAIVKAGAQRIAVRSALMAGDLKANKKLLQSLVH
ncbi:TPA: ribulose-phosphate 3-epimerase [Candidatus Woesearchaeota archaeon]|nr:ribulose-phosphate 3-epimerase [Candidatus Woesearchaeota archaeon]